MPIAAIAAIGGSIVSGIIGSHAAKSAANTEATAAQQAAAQAKEAAQTSNTLVAGNTTQANDLISGATTAANGTLAGVYQTSQGLLAPYQQLGAQAAGTLSKDLGTGGSLTTPFNASMMEANDPGYKFRLDQAQQALERSAAARGTQLSGGTLKDLASYEQGLASSEYQNAFSRYTTQQQQTYGMLSGAASLGNTAAAQGVQAGEWYGSGTSGNLMSGAGAQSTNLMNSASLQSQNTMGAAQTSSNASMAAANAKAAGTVGSANAWGNAIGGATNSLTGYAALSSMPTYSQPSLNVQSLSSLDSSGALGDPYATAVANPTVTVPTMTSGYQ